MYLGNGRSCNRYFTVLVFVHWLWSLRFDCTCILLNTCCCSSIYVSFVHVNVVTARMQVLPSHMKSVNLNHLQKLVLKTTVEWFVVLIIMTLVLCVYVN